MADYLVATVRDRIQAEEVYLALQEAGLPTSTLSIFGAGFKSGSECNHFDPAVTTKRQMKRMIFLLLPLGFLGGIIFNQSTQIDLAPSLGRIGNSVIGGVLGAGSGAMGGFSIGGGLKLRLNKTVPYEQQLQAGKYLVVVQGPDLKMRQANRILTTLDLEKLEFHERPD